jgi:diguanylate cyclase (GGDEF)-like protein
LTKKWALTRDARVRQQDLESMVRRRTAALRIAAMQDGLTGLANRTRFNERLDQTLSRISRNADEHAVVLLIDLDSFKSINDSMGHPAGDMVVKGVANRLSQSVRDSDCVARLGGDEFAILQTPVDTADDADTLARRLFELLEEPFEIDGNRIQVGMSCGIAISPQDGTTVDELLKNADLALYRAKADGRNCYRFFKEEMDQRCKHRRKTIGELKLSIEALISDSSRCDINSIQRIASPKLSPPSSSPFAAKSILVTIGNES